MKLTRIKMHKTSEIYSILTLQYDGKLNANAVNCWFIVDSGAPYTYLTVKSLKSIVGKGFTHGLHSLAIQDETTNIECHLSKAHFSNANILGADSQEALDLSIDINWKKKEFKLMRM
ncbi:unnamed protein product [Caenorhabditis sp. 36 PRJEB53466]|nr:unnamed protein product [Caenorhabditis sp. 36 PRJEB53466]